MSLRRKRPQCTYENCGSRRFHVGDDGFTYCDEGHQQSEIGAIVVEDTGELIIQGKKQKRRADNDEIVTSTAGFTGPKAVEQYLLCLQLVLRKQLKWLIDIQQLPAELEHIVRDLWALRLQKLSSRVTYDSETDTQAGANSSQGAFSSQSSNEASGTETSRSQKARKPLAASTPNLVDTLAYCYIGLQLLRSPVTVADVHGWVSEGELLFYRASREVPATMRERLPGQYQELLEPQSLLEAQGLQRRILEAAKLLHREFGMVMPALNHCLVLWRWVRKLRLPLEVYVGALRLREMLGVEFVWVVEAQGRTSRVLRFPEARLMALAVVATKLLFPWDGVERFAKSAGELTALTMDWEGWAASWSVPAESTSMRSGRNGSPGTDFSKHFATAPSDLQDASAESLDAYLDWYGSNVASENVRTQGRVGRDAEFRRALFRFFPTITTSQRGYATDNNSGTHGNTATEDQAADTRAREAGPGITATSDLMPVQQVQASLHPRRIVPEPPGALGTSRKEKDDAPRAGDFYVRYRRLSDLQKQAASYAEGSGAWIALLFYRQAAELCGLSLESMVKAVWGIEKSLEKKQMQGVRDEG